MPGVAEVSADLTIRVISFARLHHEILLLHGQTNLVVSGRGVGFLRHVSQAVLVPQFLVDRRVNLIDRQFLRYFEETPSGFLRQLLQNLFPVGPILFLLTMASAAHAASSHPPAPVTSAVPAISAAV